MVLFRNGTDQNGFRTHFFLSFPTCKRSPSFWNRYASFFPEPVFLLRQPFTDKPHAFCALHFRSNMADKMKKAAPRKAATKAVEPWKDYVEMFFNTFFQKHFSELSDTLLLRPKFVYSSFEETQK